MLAWETIDEFLKARGIRVGAPAGGPSGPQTTGGTHVHGSYHYQGRARDYGNSNTDARAIALALKPLASAKNPPVVELFYSPLGIFYKNGSAFSPSAKLRADHQDHVHVALRPGIDLRKIAVAAASGIGALLILGGVGLALVAARNN